MKEPLHLKRSLLHVHLDATLAALPEGHASLQRQDAMVRTIWAWLQEQNPGRLFSERELAYHVQKELTHFEKAQQTRQQHRRDDEFFARQSPLPLEGETVKARQPSSAADIIRSSKKLKSLTPTPSQHKLVNTGLQIRELAPHHPDKTYLARELIQATLPHANPRGNPPVWMRRAGNVSLSVRPTFRRDPSTGEYQYLYPYGSIPRLLLFWLTSEIISKKQRRIELGDTLADFMRRLGLDPSRGGKRSDAARLKEQMWRLFGAEICFDLSADDYSKWQYMRVAPKGELWWDAKRPAQADLWKSWIEVGEDFYEAVRANPVPVDIRALRALKRSPLALDLYAWCAYHAFLARRRKSRYDVTWNQLHLVMGGEYADVKDFGKKARGALRKIQQVYSTLELSITKGGFIIHERSGLPVAPEAALTTVGA